MNATLEACLLKHSGAEVTAVQTLRDNRTIPGPREASGLRRVYRRFPSEEVTV
jgi:hypothetical protein